MIHEDQSIMDANLVACERDSHKEPMKTEDAYCCSCDTRMVVSAGTEECPYCHHVGFIMRRPS